MTELIKSYHELILLPSFEERFEYLKCVGYVGEETFGNKRYLNQAFYRSNEWKQFRKHILVRDMGCDLGIKDRQTDCYEMLTIHHINPITIDDILERNPLLLDPNNAITCFYNTHKAIHYGTDYLQSIAIADRKPNDMAPWRL